LAQLNHPVDEVILSEDAVRRRKLTRLKPANINTGAVFTERVCLLINSHAKSGIEGHKLY
jgi:hypothetical protein